MGGTIQCVSFWIRKKGPSSSMKVMGRVSHPYILHHSKVRIYSKLKCASDSSK